MGTDIRGLDVNATFFNLVSGIEELEELTAPGWFNNNAAGWGAVFAGAVITGILVT